MRSNVVEALRPEVYAGGFVKDDGLVAFYHRIHALLDDSMTVLDLGCGRGEVFHIDPGPQAYRPKIAKLQGHVRKVIGVDVHDGIFQHPFLDERHQMQVGDPLPLADRSVDLVISDWVLEHIQEPTNFVAELDRVLKVGGWVCARTPNKWGYAGIGARLVPNRLHTTLLKRLWPSRQEQDTFPTVYKMNSLPAIRKLFPEGKWRNCSYTQTTMPKYFGTSSLLFRLIDLYQTIVPDAMSTNLLVFVQKRRS